MLSIACLPVSPELCSTSGKHTWKRGLTVTLELCLPRIKAVLLHINFSEFFLLKLLCVTHWAEKHLALAQSNFQWTWKARDKQYLGMINCRATQRLWQKEVEKETINYGKPEDIDIFVNFWGRKIDLSTLEER